jgi:tetratricopeptide (TPR) repeat protein
VVQTAYVYDWLDNLYTCGGIMNAADEANSPVIMQGSAGARSYAGEPFLRHLIQAKEMLAAYCKEYPDKGDSYLTGLANLTLGKICDLQGQREQALKYYKKVSKFEQMGNEKLLADLFLSLKMNLKNAGSPYGGTLTLPKRCSAFPSSSIYPADTMSSSGKENDIASPRLKKGKNFSLRTRGQGVFIWNLPTHHCRFSNLNRPLGAALFF